jgi:hypothetical protein
VNHFLNCQNLSNSFNFSHTLQKDFMHALQIVFRETGSVTHKKGAGTEEIVTRSKLRRTFSNP